MFGNWALCLPVLLPLLAGLGMAFMKRAEDEKFRNTYTVVTLVLSLICTLIAALGQDRSLVVWQMTRDIPILWQNDSLSRFFILLVAIMWTLTGIYSFEYIRHEEHPRRFYACYLMTLGILSGLCFAGNIVTFYMFYEAMTLITLPLVLHTMKKDAIAAGIKYLIYSVFGASAALLGIFFCNRYCETIAFVPGGSLVEGAMSTVFPTILFILILGFGTKAGMFPLHGWLPTAHPVAPAPASAVLSGVITKMGVLGTIRVVYYMVGADNLRGTWVQYAWMILTLITVFMGSMMALREKVFKKRLAFSTVSQVSYILFGLSTLTTVGFTGALLHIVGHSAVKITLFMTAGCVICRTGVTEVDDLRGMGLRMPKVMGIFTLASMGLVGIPPTMGFISKWYLAEGALQMSGPLAWIGPAVLLLSAILTAAYLLTVSVKAFFPGADYDRTLATPAEPGAGMWVPMAVLVCASIVLGIVPSILIRFIETLTSVLL